MNARRLVKLHRNMRLRGSLLPRARALVFTLCALPFATLLVAPGTALAESCPNAAFRTGPALHLPDCRAYELVTPAFKNGDATIENYTGISPDGEAVGFYGITAFAGAEANEQTLGSVSYVARRTEAGWATTSLTPPASRFFEAVPGLGGADFARTPDQLSEGWFLRGVSQPENEIDLYLDKADGSLVDFGPLFPPTVTSGPPTTAEPYDPEGVFRGIEQIDGLSTDGSHVVFDLTGAALAQWPGAGPGVLLEYVGAGNTAPLLLGVEDDGKFIDECPTQDLAHDSVGSGSVDSSDNNLSVDGSVALITDPCDHQLYARLDSGQPDARTVAVSEPSVEDCAACDTAQAVRQNPLWLGSSEDGSKVFFATKQPLLDGSAEENIYEYDLDAPAGQRVVRVTAGDATVVNPSVGLRSVVGVSGDGSHVYFIAGGVLSTAPNERGESAQPGANNLYVYERDALYPAGRTVFVASVGEAPGSPQTTPDGRFLLFTSATNLTPDATRGGAFEYDSQTGSMVRVSVGQGGYDDDGNGAAVALANTDDEPSRSMSADGSYVFFQSPDALTPQALNHVVVGQQKSGGPPEDANNVYEYHDGSVSLISDGQDIAGVPTGLEGGTGSPVKLLGTDPSGGDVFFTTADRLVAQDTNSNVDVYDARIGGGFPPPPAPAECEGDACQGELGAAPVLLSPGSEFQAGGEDFNAEEPKTNGSPKATAVKPKPKSKSKHRSAKRRAGAKVKHRLGRVVRVGVSGSGNGGRS